MTKKIAVSLPDDVAERLEGLPNVSAFVADALRHRLRAIDARRQLVDAGFAITDEGIADARARRLAAHAAITDEVREQAEALHARVTGARV